MKSNYFVAVRHEDGTTNVVECEAIGYEEARQAALNYFATAKVALYLIKGGKK